MADAVSQVAAQTGLTASQQSRQKLVQDLDTFLTLLTAQLQNQDPLSPMDSTEFTNQLVQFAQVEQQIYQNENLENLLISQTATQQAMAVNYLGSTIEAESTRVPLQDGKAKLAYGLAEDASETWIAIKDSTGTVVRMFEGKTTAGVHALNWDGLDSYGNQLEDGAYEVVVTALGPNEGQIDTWTTVFGKVTGITTVDDEMLLSMDGVGVPMSKVLAISDNYQGIDDKDDDSSVLQDILDALTGADDGDDTTGETGETGDDTAGDDTTGDDTTGDDTATDDTADDTATGDDDEQTTT
ncbi:flagellar hook assembly protein FlgD [Roseospirillum parvum]|uniref:Basal-body rod modification protein FlgD n=1 Tax=Roseospirillum parvum TaxID=83401 RepID=A0A1G7WAS7_9PROT|nr:flagellar hook capping FlgD N-terminal domain-containing protein [Roseospirillum parvum]SDG68190.1 flagellar basal-body rod modification protein FlgD [Roseospirillum parvum]